jgi:hypothetical protein
LASPISNFKETTRGKTLGSVSRKKKRVFLMVEFIAKEKEQRR